MATIRLGRYELEEYGLPRVCMCCGARATTFKRRKFSWYPPWAFFALGAIGAMMFSKTVMVDVPLCEKHRSHWNLRTAFALVGIAAFVVLFFAGIAVASQDEDLAPFVFIPLGVLFLAWLIAAIILSSSAIRPTEITDKSVTLRGVSEDFIEALNEARRGEEDRPRRGRGREDEDDRPRARRRPAAEDEEERPRARRRPAEEDDDGGYYDPEARKKRRRPSSDAYEEGDDR
jgi:hypothetical protein